MANNKALLAKKRRVELMCLGIDPTFYYYVSNYLNREYKFIVKNQQVILFDDQNETISPQEIVSDLRTWFYLSDEMSRIIYKEWHRDRYIYHFMTEKVSLHWEFLNVPLLYEDDNDGYNF